MTERIKAKTVNQVDDVLQGYLDQLLVLGTEVDDVSTNKIRKAVSKEVVNKEAVAALPVESRDLAVVDNINQLAEPLVQEGGRSDLDWRSSQGVECLIFKVAGLKLAIPLSLLGGVHNASDKITPLFGQAKWSLGVWQSDEQKLTIIDSALLIMPERGIKLSEQGFHYVIQLDRSPWALACQEICDTITLVHDSIKWRGDLSKRPWLAGTVIDEMCALIDVPNLMGMLEHNTQPVQ